MAGLATTPAAAGRTASPEWRRGAVIYQIYPRSFADSNDDGVGDLPGITAKLDYVASLGVDAIWLSPFFPSPMADFGYDVSDFCDVDPLFGSLEDFDALLGRAHALGLKVIIDQVYSHTSHAHAWFAESRSSRSNDKSDWYVWADPKPDGAPPNNWQSVFGGPAWTWDARRGQYYLHNFLAAQPDLNLHHRPVQDALLDAARFWLDRGVDGFRLDVVNFWMHDPALRDNPPAPCDSRPRVRSVDFQLPHFNQSHPDTAAFLARLRQVTDSYGEGLLVAELGGERSCDALDRFVAQRDGAHSAYNFHFLYADALTPRSVAAIAEGGFAGENWPSWAFSNHDAPRAASRFAPSAHRAAAAAQLMTLLLCLRGNVFVYQGEELGLPQADLPFERLRDPEAIANWPHTLGRDGARTPMPWRKDAPFAGFSRVEPWLPTDPAQAALAADGQRTDPASTLSIARRAIAMRRRVQALRTGGIRILQADEAMLVFQRGEGPEAALCAFNLSSAPQSWRAPEGWRPAFSVNGGGDGMPPYGGLICERV